MSTRSRFGILSAVVTVALVAACSSSDGDSSATGPTGPGGAGQGPTTSSSATTGGGGQGGMGGGGTGGVGGVVGCQGDDDCNEIDKPYCNTLTGDCVGCLSSDQCDTSQYCNQDTHACEVGCDDNTDCLGGNDLVCDPDTHKCVGCVIDTDCPLGSICPNGTCVPGCSGIQSCQPGFSCCNASCYDLKNDEEHCGLCTGVCDPLPNAAPLCSNGQCAMGACSPAYADCNSQTADGCEWNILQDGPCTCTPGDTQPCYQGSPGTQNIGPCKAGLETCNANGTGWSACVGQVLPSSELCGNNVDEDCDGTTDNGADSDGDGWTACDGDCCDVVGPGCNSPQLVNPGAFEFVGNGLDDDCDPGTSDNVPVPACSTVAKFAGVSPDDIAKAMDLCQFTTANPPVAQKKWGVVKTEFLLANGQVPSATALSNMQGKQAAVLTDFGSAVFPKKNSTMAGIATGMMRDQGDPGWVSPSTSLGSNSQPPPVYLAAHGGALPASASCNGACPAGTGAYDPINVRMTIRVPTNAQSFSYNFKFYSAEYPEWLCQTYNDFYLALLTTGVQKCPPAVMGDPCIPLDTNISFDAMKNPVSVNNGFLDVCQTGPGLAMCYTCPAGDGELANTGMQNSIGAGTKWLTTDAPIVPGETIVLELTVFDVSDNLFDSLALLDNFVWSISPAVVGTHE